MALLYDANGDEIYEGGITRTDVRAAMQAAILADNWELANEIADRYDLHGLCLACVEALATTFVCPGPSNQRYRVCETCEEKHRPVGIDFSDVKVMMHGLISRTVV